MTVPMPDYIERLIRRPPPPAAGIIPGTTPVVAFGDFRQARIATLGINPSRVEFLDKDGRELTAAARRLATCQSLQVSDLATAPAAALAQVLADCDNYFQRNPYRRWFNQLEPVLNACGASYYQGTACHLDLAQWATDPTWRKLPTAVRNRLLQDGLPFLFEQLANENIELLLLNGRRVVTTLRKAANVTIAKVEPVVGQNTRLFTGMVGDKTQVIGWSANLQSSFGVTNELKAAIAARVAELAGR